MNNEVQCIPKETKHRTLKMLIGLISFILGTYLMVALSFLVIYTVMQGQNPFRTPESIISGIIIWFLLPTFLVTKVKELIFTNWIKVSTTELHISRGFFWKKIPYKDISELKKLQNDDLEIAYAGSTFLLTHDDLDECYDVLLSKLEKHCHSKIHTPNEFNKGVK